MIRETAFRYKIVKGTETNNRHIEPGSRPTVAIVRSLDDNNAVKLINGAKEWGDNTKVANLPADQVAKVKTFPPRS